MLQLATYGISYSSDLLLDTKYNQPLVGAVLGLEEIRTNQKRKNEVNRVQIDTTFCTNEGFTLANKGKSA